MKCQSIARLCSHMNQSNRIVCGHHPMLCLSSASIYVQNIRKALPSPPAHTHVRIPVPLLSFSLTLILQRSERVCISCKQIIFYGLLIGVFWCYFCGAFCYFWSASKQIIYERKIKVKKKTVSYILLFHFAFRIG